MDITDKTVLITGTNRGIGRALVDEALLRGARRVFAGSRGPMAHPDARVMPLTLDVTNDTQVRQASEIADALDVLINNAGIALYDDLSDPNVIEQHVQVNVLGSSRPTPSRKRQP